MLEATRAATGDHLMACVIGANYDLYRYGYEDIPAHKFGDNDAPQPIELQYETTKAYDYVLDEQSVAVYAENMEAELATLNDKLVLTGKNYNVLRSSDGKLLATTNPDLYSADLYSELNGFGVEIGDIINVTPTVDGDTGAGRTYARRVVDVIGKEIKSRVLAGSKYNTDDAEKTSASMYDLSVKESTTGAAANDTVEVVCAKGAYTGSKDTTYFVTVLEDATSKTVRVRVSDSAGVDQSEQVTITLEGEAVAVGTKGLKLTIGKASSSDSKALMQGDTFSFVARATTESTEAFDAIVLDAAPVNVASWVRKSGWETTTLDRVIVGKEYSGDLHKDISWNIEGNTVTLHGNLGLSIEGRDGIAPFVSNVGNIYVSFRVQIIPGEDEDVMEFDELDDITEKLGTIATENDLAYGVYCAFKASGGRTVYGIRVRGNLAEHYLAAVKKTETDKRTYTFAPMTSNYTAMQAVVDFNEELSQPDVKMWRRTVCNVGEPGEYLIANYAVSLNQSGSADAIDTLEPLKATFVPLADGTGNCLMQIDDDLVFDLFHIPVAGGGSVKLRNGDLVMLEAINAKYKVKEVLSEKELILQSGPETTISTATFISIWKADTASNAVEYIGARANAFSNRRVLLAWCDGATTTEYVVKDDEETAVAVPVDSKYIAAYIAGLSSAVLPQQSITHTEVDIVDRAPKMYTKYSQKELDEIASYGVLIVTQDTKDTPCYIRHQLTTDIMKGSLYYEDSVTRNLDNISYAMCDILEPYIGKANVTPSALQAIKVAATNRLIAFTQDSTDDMIGPSLVNWENLDVYQDPVAKDRIIIRVDLYLPLPLNNIKLYEMAYAATVTI